MKNAGDVEDVVLEVETREKQASSLTQNMMSLSMCFHDLNVSVTAPNFANDGKVETKQILHNISGSVRPGEVMALLGPTGAGKSTLLNCLAGRHKADTGRIHFRRAHKVGALEPVSMSRGVSDTTSMVSAASRKNNIKKYKRHVGYVMQDDTGFYGNLTVDETLMYSAQLRLPESMPLEQKRKIVDDTLELLSLTGCKDSQFGGFGAAKVISGGERKRTSIANELITSPAVLLLDEPTSGLDSVTALQVVRILRRLADQGRTVLMTIHQPSSIMFQLFDKVMLLSGGHCFYEGVADEAIPFLESIGHPCPRYYNPCDFFLELASMERDQITEATRQFHERLRNKRICDGCHLPLHADTHDELQKQSIAESKQAGDSGDQDDDDDDDSGSSSSSSNVSVASDAEDAKQADNAVELRERKRSKRSDSVPLKGRKAEDSAMARPKSHKHAKYATSFWTQIKVLSQRNYVKERGDRLTNLYFMQFFTMSIIMGLIWWQMDQKESAVLDRLGFIFFISIFWCFNSIFITLLSIPPELHVLKRERSAGSYRLLAFYISKTLSSLPIEFIYPTLTIVLTYWMVGLDADAGKFILFYLVIIATYVTGASFGLLVGTAVLNMQRAIVYASVVMLGSMLISGFYVAVDNLPPFIAWAQYLAFPRYSYDALIQIELTGLTFSCTDPNARASEEYATTCPISGEAVIAHGSHDNLSVGGNVAMLFAFAVVMRTAAYFFLRKNSRP